VNVQSVVDHYSFELIPIAIVVAYLLAGGAYRKQAAQGFDLGQGL
jgi:hypothetical protein